MPLFFYIVSASTTKFGQSHVFRLESMALFLYPDTKIQKRKAECSMVYATLLNLNRLGSPVRLHVECLHSCGIRAVHDCGVRSL